MLVEFVLWAVLGLGLATVTALGFAALRGLRRAAAVIDEVRHLEVTASLDVDEDEG